MRTLPKARRSFLTMNHFAYFLRSPGGAACLVGLLLFCPSGGSAQDTGDDPPETLVLAAQPISKGGLVVRLGAGQAQWISPLVSGGHHVVEVLDTDAQKVETEQKRLQAGSLYGLVSVLQATSNQALPYSENLVNEIEVAGYAVPAGEIFRVLTPGGRVFGVLRAPLDEESLTATGFEAIEISLATADGAAAHFSARKPWPADMDGWSHPRHAADGNAVSADTAVGPPDRIRWVAAATSEVEGLVTADGRNFYGGILSRDSFNGLRLWHRDLGSESNSANAAEFDLPRLSGGRARPIAAAKYVFAVVGGNSMVALDATTGEIVRKFAGIETPRDILHERDAVVVTHDSGVVAFSTETGREMWRFSAAEARSVVAGNDRVSLIQGRPKRGEKSEAVTLDLYSGEVLWRTEGFAWLDRVTRSVMHGEQLAYETSSLNDSDAGNAIYIVSAKDGKYSWEKAFPPGMNHRRQARAMFVEDNLWILHGGRLNYEEKDKSKQSRAATEVSALDPETGEVRVTHPAGMAHCFPPVATPEFMLAGVLDLTDLDSGEIIANRITKANCSTENGWVPANGLIYTTPKHCTCWPMLRGFVAMAGRAQGEPATHRDLEKIDFPLENGSAQADPDAAHSATDDWPMYRGDRWRSASSASAGPESLSVLWKTAVSPALEVAALTGPTTSPILHDWRENPFIKGPVSAPVIANGQVLVARTEAHEVVAMDANSGAVNWRFTANGRIDTPPTIHRGICLFGTHAGWVYALRADNGELIWKMRATPDEERIVAYGQVESAWPVAGSVLVMDDIAYFAAGRQPLADGGIFLFAVDPLSGARHWVHRLDDMPQSNDTPSTEAFKGFYENSGLEFDPIDILHAEGDGLAMSRWVMSRDGQTVSVDKWNGFSRMEAGEDSKGGVWIPRGSWTYGARHQQRFRGEASLRPLVAFREDQVVASLNGSTDVFARDFNLDQGETFDSKWITGWQAAGEGNKGGKPYRTYRIAEGAKWTVDPFATAEEKLAQAAQEPGTQVYNDIFALALSGDGRAYAVHKDGRMKVLALADGKVLAEATVPAPVWDGLAIAGGKLYLTTKAGELVCLGAE